MLNTSMLQSRQHLTLSEAQEISIKPLRGSNYPNTLMSSEHFEYHLISTHILKILTFVETFWVIGFQVGSSLFTTAGRKQKQCFYYSFLINSLSCVTFFLLLDLWQHALQVQEGRCWQMITPLKLTTPEHSDPFKTVLEAQFLSQLTLFLHHTASYSTFYPTHLLTACLKQIGLFSDFCSDILLLLQRQHTERDHHCVPF